MARAFLDSWPGRVTAGLVIGSHCPIDLPRAMSWHQGAHPAPDERSLAAGIAALAFVASGEADEPLVFLLSGGASSLMAAPVSSVSVDQKRRVTSTLLSAGADIDTLNTVRKHLSRVKGGWLAAQTAARSVTLAISDVVGDDLSVIASGPTVGDPTRFSDALLALDRFGGRAAYPPPVVRWLEAGRAGIAPETPKPGDARLLRATARVIGSRRDAMEGARAAADALGYRTVVIEGAISGEARVAAREHVATLARQVRPSAGPTCVISSGETTVTVTGRGLGGRNQEFALAAAPLLASIGSEVVLASVGTDGIDGPTDAAGALADTSTLVRAEQAALGDPARYLDANDSYPFFSALADLLVTGPTETNVGDLQVVLIAGK